MLCVFGHYTYNSSHKCDPVSSSFAIESRKKAGPLLTRIIFKKLSLLSTKRSLNVRARSKRPVGKLSFDFAIGVEVEYIDALPAELVSNDETD